MHEASLYDANAFITLTYDDEHVGTSLCYDDYQLFMRYLRRAFGKVRFFMCGEYGDTNGRAHYHACIFGENFYSDRYPWRISPSGNQLYRSPSLEACWKYGSVEIGDLTFESAAYVARYCVKKVTGEKAKDHYESLDIRTGEIITKVPEFCRMSLKPGIGMDWLRLYHGELLANRAVVVNGVKAALPRYYKEYLSELTEYGVMKAELVDIARKRIDNAPKRLAVREKVAKANMSKQVTRSL